MSVFISIVIACFVVAALYYLFMSSTSQIFGSYPWQKKTNEKIVALTFDDGPNEPFTSQIADYLSKKHIKATFFEVGTCVEKYPDVTKRLYADGHVIGNHSVHHRFHDHLLHPRYEKEIADNQAILQKHIGVTPALFRSPWLFRQPFLLATTRAHNLHAISGKFCHPFEVMQPSAERIAKRTLKKARPGSIIIFHDGFDARGGNRAQTVDAVKRTVESLLEKGYRFVTISDLLDIPPYQT